MAQKSRETFRTALKDWVIDKTGTALDRMDSTTQSRWMTKFYVEEVVRITEPTLLPDDDEDFEDCFVDGKNDNEVDFIYRTSGGLVFILQIKYRGHNKTENDADFSSFCGVLQRLHPRVGRKYIKNDKLARALLDIDWENDSFRLEFVSLAKSTRAIRNCEQLGIQPIKGFKGVEDRSQITFLEQTDLNTTLRSALTKADGVEGTIPLRFSAEGHTPWIPYTNSDGRKSYIGKIKAGELNLLCQNPKYRNKIFAMNIRNFVGDTATNKAIIKSALENAKHFFYFNNGISAVATSITPDESTKTLNCDRLSIINGAQTVHSIYKAFQKKASDAARYENDDPSQGEVLIRVTEIDYSSSDEESEFITNIIRYNNTQNAMKPSDFRSNDVIQRRLNTMFAKLSRSGKYFWYKNKRTGERKTGTIGIGMEEFIKTVFSFWFGSHECFGGAKHLFDTTSTGGYRRLFGEEGEQWEDLSKADFEWLAGSWFVCELVRVFWKQLKDEMVRLEDKRAEERMNNGNERIRPIAKQSLERRWMVFYTVGLLLRRKYEDEGSDLKDGLRKLSNPKWTDKNTSTTMKAIEDYSKQACELLMDVYDSKCENPKFSQRNWFRSKTTLDDIADRIDRKPMLLSKLTVLSTS
jgi:hypothetical protein